MKAKQMQSSTLTTDLTELVQQTHENLVSIVLPTYQASRDVEQNAIRFKNLLRQTQQELVRKGVSPGEAERQLTRLSALQRDDHFWQHQSAGLAVYLADDIETIVKLHWSPDEFTMVADHYFVTPVAVDLAAHRLITVLSLTWEQAQLESVTRNESVPVDTDLFPVAMRDVVLAPDPEDQLQFRTQQSGSGGEAMFHGQGGGEAIIESDRRHFLTEVGKRLERLYGGRDVQLMLFATDEVAGHWQDVTGIEPLKVISGSPASLNPQQRRERVLETMQKLGDQVPWEGQLNAALAGGKGTQEIGEVLTSAANGRVAQLLINPRAQIWGRWDASTQQTSLANDSGGSDEKKHTELINLAVIQTLSSGGEIIPLEDTWFDAVRVAAIYRY